MVGGRRGCAACAGACRFACPTSRRSSTELDLDALRKRAVGARGGEGSGLERVPRRHAAAGVARGTREAGAITPASLVPAAAGLRDRRGGVAARGGGGARGGRRRGRPPCAGGASGRRAAPRPPPRRGGGGRGR